MLQKLYHFKPAAFVIVDGQLIKVLAAPTVIYTEIPIIQINSLSSDSDLEPGSDASLSSLPEVAPSIPDDHSEGRAGSEQQQKSQGTRHRVEGEQ